ncbi:MAG: DUF2971 domain-containing protein [Bacteroidales bacterium]|nr:DUF2971 domain-containing protein [Bacteroidales bacterium]
MEYSIIQEGNLKKHVIETDIATYFAIYENNNIKNFLKKEKSSNYVPSEVVKYYSIKKRNIKAITQNYVYATHPSKFNDPFDCIEEIFGLKNITQEKMWKLFKLIFKGEIEFQKFVKKDFKKAKKYYGKYFYRVLFAKLGIVSCTTEETNRNMWNYYSQYNGFAVKFDVKNKPYELKGPFPISYLDNYEIIDLNMVDEGVAMLYLTTVKAKSWKDENEWRFLAIGPEYMEIPFHKLKGAHDRKFKYSKEFVKEITFGLTFFEHKELKIINETIMQVELDTDHENYQCKFDLLNYITENRFIKTSMIVKKNDNTFKITKANIDITKYQNEKYKFELINVFY